MQAFVTVAAVCNDVQRLSEAENKLFDNARLIGFPCDFLCKSHQKMTSTFLFTCKSPTLHVSKEYNHVSNVFILISGSYYLDLVACCEEAARSGRL